MLRASNHPEFCHHHAQQQLRALKCTPLEPLAAEIVGPLRDLRSAAALNSALANAFVQLADGRLDTRRASALTNMAQVIFQTLKPVGWEQIDRDPAPELRAALTTMLKLPKSNTKAAKFAQEVFNRFKSKAESGSSS
jgi:hypothetical protein